MFELRWLHETIDAGIDHVVIRLQYRTRLVENLASGEPVLSHAWGKWVDVPTIHEDRRPIEDNEAS